MQKRIQIVCTWSGVIAAVIVGVGLLLLAKFIPPPHPDDPASTFVAQYQHNLVGIRVGVTLMIITLALLVPWSIVIAARTRRVEGSMPILTYGQIAAIPFGFAVNTMASVSWLAAAFRVGSADAETIRLFTDVGWFLFLIVWPIFSVWCVLIAAAIFTNQSGRPFFPRWVGYFNLWCALAFVPGFTVVFFKTGPLAYNGILGFWLSTIFFFVWLAVMTVEMLKLINLDTPDDEHRDASEWLGVSTHHADPRLPKAVTDTTVAR